jgi:hypothetical protein
LQTWLVGLAHDLQLAVLRGAGIGSPTDVLQGLLVPCICYFYLDREKVIGLEMEK